MANKTKAELLAEAKAKDVEVAEDATNKEIQEAINTAKDTKEPTETAPEVDTVGAPDTRPSVEASQGSEIAKAISEGMKSAGKGRPIKIVADGSIESRFAVVRNKQTGEVMLRENATGTLSKVQLKSIEEKEAEVQEQEVEEI